jgi:hypothetical protein
MIEFSSSSTGLEGVNNVFSHVSLILDTTFSIFAKLLLTSFLALVHRTCTPMFLEQNKWVSQKQGAHGNLVVASLPVNFLLSKPCGRRLMCTSVGLGMTHTFLSHKILELTLFCVSQATQYSPSRNHQGYPTREKKVDCCLSLTAFSLTLRSKAIVRPFLATNASQRDLQPA